MKNYKTTSSTLKEVYKDVFLIGSTLNESTVSGEPYQLKQLLKK